MDEMTLSDVDPAVRGDGAARLAEWKAHPWVAEGADRVRWGLIVGGDWEAALRRVRLAEELGFDSVWFPDHPAEFAWDAWTRMAAAAMATERVRLGTIVSCVFYRHPVLLARQVADADEVSGGRVVLGLGIGDWPGEFAKLGLPYRSVPERQAALEEFLGFFPRLWGDEPVTHRSAHWTLEAAQVASGPVQRPRVPILLAGGGEKVTLRLVAQYADASNFGAGSLIGGAWGTEDVRRKYGVLRAHCADLARPYDSVLRTHFGMGIGLRDGTEPRVERRVWPGIQLEYDIFTGSPDDAVAHYQALADAGMQYFITALEDDDMVRFAERVAPRVRLPQPAGA
jgi:alkanesulfonate monooxygenase SsuD/methylene tetrahydromethanopterin reductase-like flavin-dependent oxidoreductase (luciferase family)